MTAATLLVACSLLVSGPSLEATPGRAAAAPLPPILADLQTELRRLAFCADEIVDGRADWWGFSWTLPEKGCGDCEDFAAFSHARLRQLGVAANDIRLMAAEVGEETLADGKPARVLHLWLEAKVEGRTWTIWNQQVRAGAWRERKLLSEAEIENLVEERFGPNWPDGLEVD